MCRCYLLFCLRCHSLSAFRVNSTTAVCILRHSIVRCNLSRLTYRPLCSPSRSVAPGPAGTEIENSKRSLDCGTSFSGAGDAGCALCDNRSYIWLSCGLCSGRSTGCGSFGIVVCTPTDVQEPQRIVEAPPFASLHRVADNTRIGASCLHGRGATAFTPCCLFKAPLQGRQTNSPGEVIVMSSWSLFVFCFDGSEF